MTCQNTVLQDLWYLCEMKIVDFLLILYIIIYWTLRSLLPKNLPSQAISIKEYLLGLVFNK